MVCLTARRNWEPTSAWSHGSQTMKFLTFVWKTSYFDLQERSSDQEQQYGCHDNALQPGLFPLRALINKHGEPLVTTRSIKFTIQYYWYQYQRNSLLQNIKYFLWQSRTWFMSVSVVFLITHRYRWVRRRCTRLPPFSFMYKHCRVLHMYV